MGSPSGGEGLAIFIRREQRLGDEVVLASAQAAERHVALQDLAGARVGDRCAVAPATGVAMHPLDDVVAHVHGVGAGGEQIHLEGAGRPAGGLEGFVPPTCAFQQRGTDRLRRTAIDVVLDGRDGLTGVGAVRVSLEEAMAQDKELVQRLAERSGVVAIPGGEVAGVRVEAARREGVVHGWQLHEAVALADGQRVRVGRHVSNELAARRSVGGKGQLGLDLGVLGEGMRVVERDGRARGVDLVGALLQLRKGLGDVMHVVQEEVGCVDEHAATAIFGGDGESPQHGAGKGLRDRKLLGGVRRGAAEVLVGFDHQHLGPGALKPDDAAVRGLAAVEA